MDFFFYNCFPDIVVKTPPFKLLFQTLGTSCKGLAGRGNVDRQLHHNLTSPTWFPVVHLLLAAVLEVDATDTTLADLLSHLKQ